MQDRKIIKFPGKIIEHSEDDQLVSLTSEYGPFSFRECSWHTGATNVKIAVGLEVEISAIESTGVVISVSPRDVKQYYGRRNFSAVKDWKKQYGDIYVTSITYDKHIVWRVLNRAEYKQIVKKMEQLVQAGQLTTAEANLWNEETISELCMLYPKFDKNNAVGFMAGLPSLIAQEVLEASGFVALEVRQL